MKIARFVRNKNTLKYKIIITFVMTSFLVFSITKQICGLINEKILIYAETMIKNKNNLVVKEAFWDLESDINIDEIIILNQNSKAEIIGVDFKLSKCQIILSKVIENIDKKILQDNYMGYRLEIPLGFITNSPLTINLGPKIPLKINVANAALGNIRTEVKSFGINNALVEVYLDLIFKVETSSPLTSVFQNVTYETLIASKIITGAIPSFYGGSIKSESQTFSLPIYE